MVVSSQLTALNEHSSIIMTLTLTFTDMLQLARVENLYLRTSVARGFFGHEKKKHLLSYVKPLDGRKGR